MISHFRGSASLGALGSRANHVGLQHSALKQNVIVGKGLVNVREDLLGHLERSIL